jgi:hypothetical protein
MLEDEEHPRRDQEIEIQNEEANQLYEETLLDANEAIEFAPGM